MIKKIALILAFACIMLSLTACGGKNNSSEPYQSKESRSYSDHNNDYNGYDNNNDGIINDTIDDIENDVRNGVNDVENGLRNGMDAIDPSNNAR